MPSPKNSSRNIDGAIARIEKLRKSRKNVTLFSNPITTLTAFIFVIRDSFFSSINFSNKKLLFSGILVISAAVGLYFTPGEHQLHIDAIEDFLMLAVWWTGLGVLSSIGLGTGLHTFVLYLGPHIAKVTLTATECNTINFDETGPRAFVCPPGEGPGVTYLEILQKVQLEALLWGIGTAIGELPPYFVARTARLSGMRLEEEEGQENDTSLMGRMKNYLPSLVSNLGFFAILLFASIPNPLFDLAGITCGHCLVPFWKFFGATLIGKAFVKAHLQTIFVITVFHKEHLALVVEILEAWIPFLRGTIHPIFDKERAKLHRTGAELNEPAPKTMLQWAWDAVLISMLAYFIISIINSSAQEYLIKKDDEALKKLKASKKKN